MVAHLSPLHPPRSGNKSPYVRPQSRPRKSVWKVHGTIFVQADCRTDGPRTVALRGPVQSRPILCRIPSYPCHRGWGSIGRPLRKILGVLVIYECVSPTVHGTAAVWASIADHQHLSSLSYPSLAGRALLYNVGLTTPSYPLFSSSVIQVFQLSSTHNLLVNHLIHILIQSLLSTLASTHVLFIRTRTRSAGSADQLRRFPTWRIRHLTPFPRIN